MSKFKTGLEISEEIRLSVENNIVPSKTAYMKFCSNEDLRKAMIKLSQSDKGINFVFVRAFLELKKELERD